MRKKERLLWRYGLLAVVALGLSLWGGMVLLDRSTEVPVEGLVPGLTDALAQEIPREAPLFRFTPVALPFRHFEGKRTHRLPEDMGSGVLLEDLDGDGRIDMLFANQGPLGAPPPPPALFRNKGDFLFERVEGALPLLQEWGSPPPTTTRTATSTSTSPATAAIASCAMRGDSASWT
ncbi:MAG: hypothetical protein HC813_01905 [Planctomycetes bacterium]|nr:hypothetical protein [Planctomycetota bacterium]